MKKIERYTHRGILRVKEPRGSELGLVNIWRCREDKFRPDRFLHLKTSVTRVRVN